MIPRDYPPRPLVGVGAVVLRGDRVLLVRRAKPPRNGEWSLPGGLQKLGETVFEAATREVLEETGVVVRPFAVVDVVDLIERDSDAAGGVRWHYTLIDVIAAWRAGEPQAASDASQAVWAAISDVPRLVRWEKTVRIIKQAQSHYGSSPRAEPG